MYCNNCGSIVGKQSKFCPNCGAPLDVSVVKVVDASEGTQVVEQTVPVAPGYAASTQTVAVVSQGGASPLSIAAFVLSFFLVIIPCILALVDLTGNRPEYSHTLSIAALVIDCISLIIWIALFGSFGSLLYFFL